MRARVCVFGCSGSDVGSLPTGIPAVLGNAVFVLFAKRTIMGDQERFDNLDRMLEKNMDGWRRILANPQAFYVRKPSGLTLDHFVKTTGIVPVLCAKYFSEDGVVLARERGYVPLSVTGSRYVPSGGGATWTSRLVDIAAKCLRRL
jgi:hypothetical protein